MCHDWAFKGCIVQPGFQFSPALREWESVGIQLRPLGNAAYVACLLLLCQGSEWLSGKSVWLVFRRSRITAGSWIFFRGFISHSLNKNIIHEYLLSLTTSLWIYEFCLMLRMHGLRWSTSHRNVVIVNTKHLSHVYHCQQSKLTVF